MTYPERSILYNLLHNLSDTDAKSILEIIKENGEEWSENRNGVFFDLGRVSEKTVRLLLKLQNQRNTLP